MSFPCWNQKDKLFSFPGFLLFRQKFASIILQDDECERRDLGARCWRCSVREALAAGIFPWLWSVCGVSMRTPWILSLENRDEKGLSYPHKQHVCTWGRRVALGFGCPGGLCVCDIGQTLHLQALLCILSTKIALFHSQEN